LDKATTAPPEFQSTPSETPPAQVTPSTQPDSHSSTSILSASSRDPKSEQQQQRPSAPKIDPSKLTYHVSRTHSNNLPVYNQTRGGGTQKLTQIRKVSGDQQKLKTDIAEALSLNVSNVFVKAPANDVWIKGGFYRTDVASFLRSKGF
jgi:large subunit ribosomal protein L49